MNKKIMTLLASAAAVVSGLAGIPAAHAASTTLTYGVIGDLTSWEASAAQAGNLAPFYQAVYDPSLFSEQTNKLTKDLSYWFEPEREIDEIMNSHYELADDATKEKVEKMGTDFVKSFFSDLQKIS